MKKSSLFLLLLLLWSHSKKAPGNTSYLGSERWRARRTREKLEREMTRSLSLSASSSSSTRRTHHLILTTKETGRFQTRRK